MLFRPEAFVNVRLAVYNYTKHSIKNHLNYYNYFTEIEETFIRRRGKNLLLSPLDWALIEDWQERGIPLHIVIRSIESVFDVFDKQPIRPRTIKSLFYCREEIEAQYAEWAASQAGSSEPVNGEPADGKVTEDLISSHLLSAAEKLEAAKKDADAALVDAIDRVMGRLVEVIDDRDDTERLEKSLEGLDRVIDESLLADERAAKISLEIEKQLAEYKRKMDVDTYKRTVELMTVKRLREDTGMPRLSLFYL